MYEFVRGTLVKKLPTEAVLDVNGVGYALKISVSSSEQLPSEGETATLLTYLHVREDILQLYGFSTEDERTVFKGLISISGVGPKLAQTILSGLSAARLVQAIQSGDEAALNRISGVGKKTAQRLIVELKDKLPAGGLSAEHAPDATALQPDDLEREALMALMSLGYSKAKAEQAIIKIRRADEKILTAEEMIKKALQAV